MKQIIGSILFAISLLVAIGVDSKLYSQVYPSLKFAASPTSPITGVPIYRFSGSEITRQPNADPIFVSENPSAKLFPKRSKPDEGWHFSVAPYLYASGISGTVGARGRTIDINASFGDVWKKLDVPLMVVFEVRKQRFFSLTDLVWVKLSDQRDTPGDIYSARKVGVNLFVLDPEVGYRLVQKEKATFDVLGGASIWSVETAINVTSGRLPGFDVSMRKTWASPVIGVRGNYAVTPKFFASTRFEIGGAGIGADLATKFYGGFGYRIGSRAALIGGYRFLQVDYDDHRGFLFNTRMHGLVAGARFSF